MNCNYKVNIKDIQNKYKFNIFAMGGYNDSDLRKMIESVYYALPRVNGSGTSVTLTDTAFSYMKNKLYATDISQEGEPTINAPQTIHTISGDNEVVVRGKNLIPFTNQDFTLNGLRYYVNNGSLYVDGTSSGEVYSTNASFKNNFNFTLPAGTYTLQRDNNVATYLDNKATGTHLVTNSGSFTLNETTEVNLGFYIYKLSFANQQFKIQLEKGSTATTYEPYKSNSALLTLGDKEICKIGDYEDKIFKAIKGNEIYDSLSDAEKTTLDYGKWYLRKAIAKEVFDGTEATWVENSTTRGLFQVTLTNVLNNLNTINAKANWLRGDTGTNITSQTYYESINNTIATFTGNRLFFRIDQYKNDLAGLKTFLASNNLTAYYVYASPVNELFNDTIQDQLEDIYNNMLSYEGQTNVSQVNDDLSFNINSTALKDLNNL